MTKQFILILSVLSVFSLRAQNTESFLQKNLGRIVEVSASSGLLSLPNLLIGYDSTGLVRQASSGNIYKIFGPTPNQTDLNANLNTFNRFGSPTSHDGYEIRFGGDSSHYWINSTLAPNRLPFSVFNVGPKAANNPSVTGGVRLCLRVQDDDGNGVYTPGERIFVLGDLALPLDSTYEDTIRLRPTLPFTLNRAYITSLRFGRPDLDYTYSSFSPQTDGVLPPSGTVIRLVAKSADTSKPFIYIQDSLIAYSARRYAYPFSTYSYETPQIQIIQAPSGMVLSGDSLIWQVAEHQLGQEYPVHLRISNGIGYTDKIILARAYPIHAVIRQVCASIHPDTMANAILGLQNHITRFALAPNRREVADWIRQQLIRYGYSNARLDSFYLSNLQWPFNSGNYYSQWHYNVIAELPGAEQPDSVYILGGHHDAILYPYNMGDPFLFAPGADDNASGTVAALEVARVFKLHQYQPKHTIRFVTFAAEEFGLYGSKYYAQKARNANERIQMMINNDMIATCQDSATSWKANLLGYTNSENVLQLSKQAVEQYTTLNGYSSSLSNSTGSDSRSFFDQGYQTIFLFEYQFSPFYHSPNDVLSNCNMRYMAEMVKISCAMLMMQNGLNATIAVPESTTVPQNTMLISNYPNPFNPLTTIRYRIPQEGKVFLKIYNALGQEVRTLVHGVQPAGEYRVNWDSRDKHGQAVSSGVYIYRLQCGSSVVSGKMLLIR